MYTGLCVQNNFWRHVDISIIYSTVAMVAKILLCIATPMQTGDRTGYRRLCGIFQFLTVPILHRVDLVVYMQFHKCYNDAFFMILLITMSLVKCS